MDPDQTLADILDLAAGLEELSDQHNDRKSVDWTETADELSEKLAALDTWLCNGGFLPKRWSKAKSLNTQKKSKIPTISYGPTFRFTRRATAKLIRAAAKRLETQPIRVQGQFRDYSLLKEGGGVCGCAAGCIIIEAEAAVGGQLLSAEVLAPLQEALRLFGLDKKGGPYTWPTPWVTTLFKVNDDPNNSVKDVARFMRKMAYAIDHGGKERAPTEPKRQLKLSDVGDEASSAAE